ncbi:MAG: hypothetical protein ABIO45_08995 [Burkholderiaceae bacterium]
MRRLAFPALLLALVTLTGCEMLGIESPVRIAAVREADGKAVGGACRHAARAIEDCYAMNRKVDRAAVFAGWREMNDYMRENKIDPVAPQGVVASLASAKPATEPTTEAAATPTPAAAPAGKRASKPVAEGARGKPDHAS